MKVRHISIFNLIDIFRRGKNKIATEKNPKVHCEEKHHHDFYCDQDTLNNPIN